MALHSVPALGARPLELASRTFTPQELAEVFPHPPLREVAFELRFPARLRVQAEIWRLQDQLLGQYPEVGKESALQPNGVFLDVAVFRNPADARVIKVTNQNFLIAFTRYECFEVFKEELINRTDQFCSTFGIDQLSRVGLRYVNEIVLPSADPAALLNYVRPLVSFDRFPENLVEQFALELRAYYRTHSVAVRTALLPGVLRTYVLDIDCHHSASTLHSDYPRLLDQFHDSAQAIFLDHITEQYKALMRREK